MCRSGTGSSQRPLCYASEMEGRGPIAVLIEIEFCSAALKPDPRVARSTLTGVDPRGNRELTLLLCFANGFVL